MAKRMQPKGSVIAALDIGSSKIACFIARVRDDSGNVDVIGIGHQASQGIKSGTVVDMDAAEAAIRAAVHAAENMAADVTKGYPLRATEDYVGLLPKIIAVADVYDAMTTNRIYKKGKTALEAIDYLNHQGRSQLDSGVLLHFLNNIPVYDFKAS